MKTTRFQSTLSSQRVTQNKNITAVSKIFQSTLSSQRVTKKSKSKFIRMIISIHTLLAESDAFIACEKSDIKDFNPHSPRREWPKENYEIKKRCNISIHTLLAESDEPHHAILQQTVYFNPHSPRREWPRRSISPSHQKEISIHTLLAESDLWNTGIVEVLSDFNPHSPRREWLTFQRWQRRTNQFQSTLSSQRVTISTFSRQQSQQFQSTLSSQRVTSAIWHWLVQSVISIHTLLAESDPVW